MVANVWGRTSRVNCVDCNCRNHTCVQFRVCRKCSGTSIVSEGDDKFLIYIANSSGLTQREIAHKLGVSYEVLMKKYTAPTLVEPLRRRCQKCLRSLGFDEPMVDRVKPYDKHESGTWMECRACVGCIVHEVHPQQSSI
jgi:hypothetical protein